MNGNRPEPHLVSAAFSAMLDEHASFVLVLPGLWGLGVVHREVEALANGLRIVGGSGRLGAGDEEEGASPRQRPQWIYGAPSCPRAHPRIRTADTRAPGEASGWEGT